MPGREGGRAGLAALAALLALGACSSAELAAPVMRVRAGPAADRPVRRVVALPASCGALSLIAVPIPGDPQHKTWENRETCPANALDAVDNSIRSSLDFIGFTIIDSERVNAVTATRREIQARQGFFESTTSETEGATFTDATPFEQREILRELGAEGVLTTRILIGSSSGAGQRRTVTAQIRLLAAADGALVWARRCEIEVGGLLATDEIAIERAARCAIEGARLR